MTRTFSPTIIHVQLGQDDGEREREEHQTERPLVDANLRPEPARRRRFLNPGEGTVAVRQRCRIEHSPLFERRRRRHRSRDRHRS